MSGGLFWALFFIALAFWAGSRWGRAREAFERDLAAARRVQREQR